MGFAKKNHPSSSTPIYGNLHMYASVSAVEAISDSGSRNDSSNRFGPRQGIKMANHLNYLDWVGTWRSKISSNLSKPPESPKFMTQSCRNTTSQTWEFKDLAEWILKSSPTRSVTCVNSTAFLFFLGEINFQPLKSDWIAGRALAAITWPPVDLSTVSPDGKGANFDVPCDVGKLKAHQSVIIFFGGQIFGLLK